MHNSSASLPRAAAAGVLAALTLAACGGGGGTSAPPQATTPSPPAQPTRLHPVVLAGAATQNNGGDFADGTSANARFSNITGMASDKAGNVYVADSGNCAIRKITPAGYVSTLAGTGHCETWDSNTVPQDGAGQAARFYVLGRITADADGNLYVNDRTAIRRITPGGVVTTLAGIFYSLESAIDGAGSSARFHGILDLAAGPNGTLTVSDYTRDYLLGGGAQFICQLPNGYNTLREVSPAGVVTTVPGSNADCDPAKTALPLTQAGAVRFDKAGTLWFLHLQTLARRPAGGAAVIVKDAADQPITNPLPEGGMEIAPDDAGNLYYRIGTTITKLDTAGKRLDVVSSQAGAPADINPDMALDAMRNLTWIGNHDFVVSVNNQVVKLTLK